MSSETKPAQTLQITLASCHAEAGQKIAPRHNMPTVVTSFFTGTLRALIER